MVVLPRDIDGKLIAIRRQGGGAAPPLGPRSRKFWGLGSMEAVFKSTREVGQCKTAFTRIRS